MTAITSCIVVLSHPRSGTHLLIDFLRRNFLQTKTPLWPWESAQGLYMPLDEMDRSQRKEWLENHDRRSVIVQSHFLGFTKGPEEFVDVLAEGPTVFLYPFRRYSATTKSYADFLIEMKRWNGVGMLSDFLNIQDPFFGIRKTTGECLEKHAVSCQSLDPLFVDVDRLLLEPDKSAAAIGHALGMAPSRLKRRLPARRKFHGKLAELRERLSGRESTEVLIPRKTKWVDAMEAEKIDSRFKPIYETLRNRANRIYQ